MSKKQTADDSLRGIIRYGSDRAIAVFSALEHEVRSGEYGDDAVPCAELLARCQRLFIETFRALETADAHVLQKVIEGEVRALRDEFVTLFRTHAMPAATVTALEERITQLENELTAPGNELRARLVAVVRAEAVSPLRSFDEQTAALLNAVQGSVQSLRDLRKLISGSTEGKNGLLPTLFALYDRFTPVESEARDFSSRAALEREIAAITEVAAALNRDCITFKELRDGVASQLKDCTDEHTRLRTVLSNVHRSREIWDRVCRSLSIELTTILPDARQAASRTLSLTDRLQQIQELQRESNTLARSCDELFTRCDELFTKIKERIAVLSRRVAFDFTAGTSERDQLLTKALAVALFRSFQDVKKPSRSTKSLARAVIAAGLAQASDEPRLIALARSVDAVMGISPLRNPDLRQLTAEGHYFAARWEKEFGASVSDSLASYWKPPETPAPAAPPQDVAPEPLPAACVFSGVPASAVTDPELPPTTESSIEAAVLIALLIWNRGNTGLERNAAPLYASLVVGGLLTSGGEQRFARAVRSLSASGKLSLRREQNSGKLPVMLLRLTECGAERARILQDTRGEPELAALGRICRQEFNDTRVGSRWEIQRAAGARITYE